MKSLPVAWLKNTPDEKQRQTLEASIRNSRTALSRLYDLIEEKVEVINNQEISIADFKDASWTYKAAFRQGQKSSLKEIKDLLEFLKG